MESHHGHCFPASGTWTTRDTQNGVQGHPQWGQAVSPRIPAGMLTQASHSHFHPATSTTGLWEHFLTFPVKGWGSWETPDPDETPTASCSPGSSITHHPCAPRGTREGHSQAGSAPLRPSTVCHAGTEIGKTPGVAHAALGSSQLVLQGGPGASKPRPALTSTHHLPPFFGRSRQDRG